MFCIKLGYMYQIIIAPFEYENCNESSFNTDHRVYERIFAQEIFYL